MNSRAARRRSWTRTATESSSSRPRICIPTKTGCRRRRSTSSSSRNSMPARGASWPARSAGRRREHAGRRRRRPRRKRVPRKGNRRKRRPHARRKGPPRRESPQRNSQRKRPADVAVRPTARAWDGFLPGHSLPTGRRATMTTRSLLARTSRRPPLLRTSSALVVALLLFGLAPFAAADGAPVTSPARPSTVEGTVSEVTGPILDLIEGGIQIDVTHATITGGDNRLANPLPWSGILVGARVVAQVTVPDALLPVVPPPPLAATSVVVFQTRAGELSGTIQSVDVAGGKFTMLFHTVSTNASTKWSGGGPNGAVKGIGDLSAGMFAIVNVVNSGGLLATSVEAYGVTPPELFAFRGAVQTITSTAWTIAGHF